jgi:hypothetical protein
MSATAEALRALLEATPLPPSFEAADDVEALMAALWDSHARRAQVISGLTAPMPLVSDEERELARTLSERQLAWDTALEQARALVGTQRVNANKVRGYASALASAL